MRVTRILIAAAIVVLVASYIPVRTVLACSGDGPLLPSERFAELNISNAGAGVLVVLGEVISEHRIDPQRRPILVPEQSYVSEVKIELVLAGKAGEETLEVGPNGYGAPDCSGGPRLLPGEKVILFLRTINPSYTRTIDQQPADSGAWQTGQLNEPILFDGPSAYYIGWGRFVSSPNGPAIDSRARVGDSADVLRLGLDFGQMSRTERDRAFQFVLGIAEPADAPQPASAAQRPAVLAPKVGEAGLKGR
jgi:hypothetical protein